MRWATGKGRFADYAQEVSRCFLQYSPRSPKPCRAAVDHTVAANPSPSESEPHRATKLHKRPTREARISLSEVHDMPRSSIYATPTSSSSHDQATNCGASHFSSEAGSERHVMDNAY